MFVRYLGVTPAPKWKRCLPKQMKVQARSDVVGKMFRAFARRGCKELNVFQIWKGKGVR